MKIPSQLKIFGHIYTISMDNFFQSQSGSMGTCCSNLLEIKLSPHVPESQLSDSLLHEIIEALRYCLSMDMDHDTIVRLTTGLLHVIRENDLDFRKPLDGPS